MKKPAAAKKEVEGKIELAGKALHDEIGPLLSAAGLRLQLLRMDFPETTDRVREITRSLDEVIDRVRALSQELKPSPFSSDRPQLNARVNIETRVQLILYEFSVLLVDDHKIMRDGIKAILCRGDEFRVVGEAESGPDAVQAVKRHRPDLVLMDIGLPGLNGIETTVEILRFHPECKIVILSMYDDENSVVSAIRSGARAFILKKSFAIAICWMRCARWRAAARI